jgi:uncharacterized membrane protein YcaP (DUF421 family)
MTMLSKIEKVQIIESRLKGLEYKKFGLEIDLLVENAKTTPDSESVSSIEAAIEEVSGQLSVLNSELTEVNALAE